MDNMQLLHECKDSCDDHFRKRRQRVRLAPELIGGEPVNLEDTVENVDDTEILQHLYSIDDCCSERKNNTNANSLDCMEHAEEARLFKSKYQIPIMQLYHPHLNM
jgi:hypothetical protein